MNYLRYRNLASSMIALSKKGGSFNKAAEQIDSLIGKIARKVENPLHGLQKTNNGETRIKNCIKYDLTGRSRLVTVQTKGYCLLLFAGDHDTVDDWLDSKKGTVFGLNKDNKFEEIESQSAVIGDDSPYLSKRLRQDKPLYELVNEEIYDRFVDNLSRSTCRELEKLTCYDENRLYEITCELSDEYRKAVLDLFLALISGEIENAVRGIKLFLGEITDLEKVDVNVEVVDSEFLKKISTDEDCYPKLLRRFAEESDYKEWMLFMHPDQESIAFTDFSGPSKLLGVSGSGKTCVVIQRAIYLAKKYPKESILVLTLNKPLAELIKNLVEKLVEPECKNNIKVQPFFQICQDFLKNFEPENEKLYEDLTWKSAEHIDEVWREFYRCELGNNDASVLHDLHDTLIARGIDAEHYIKEEFDWIRSAFSKSDRDNYFDMPRQGRTIPLNIKYRRQLVEGLACWEKKMIDIGVTDYLNISTALYRHLNKIIPEYRCILIDESQDFGNIEFSIVRKLVERNENDIFLCGDAAQQISTKYQKLKEVGIELHSSRSKKITKNYRNSREILELANSVLMENLSDEMLNSDDFEILEPEYASFSGANPLLLEGNSLEDEVSSAYEYVKNHLEANQKACICISGFSQREIKVFADKINLPVLDGCMDISQNQIFISELEQTKGFEFDYVCILNCSSSVIPDPRLPPEEHFRELSRLYVAMTRAKLELILSFSNERSTLFKNSDDYFINDQWASHIEVKTSKFGQPEKLSEVVHVEDIEAEDPFKMCGDKLLYRSETIGLSSLTIDYIRNNIDGEGRVTMGANRLKRRVKWRDFADLLDDINNKAPYEHKVTNTIVEELRLLEAKLLATEQ
ncbi:UvrD-helicase domain-containing protein [Pseudoalteromonas sp. C2R02]|uniref:UvrD-helicase domain-containing protein n=1 Tax=Pseudoalteromonas sp. C2R02 TaxID=2841565 RepID=UPI001C08C0F5|nr:UvrD-helicase domain-containing protein [Pseudoalteromonas sp. C2R02]MBU2969840.1 UvrD-helicase domain-containing protein [Pseudoalteromonas sp. C2R02]